MFQTLSKSKKSKSHRTSPKVGKADEGGASCEGKRPEVWFDDVDDMLLEETDCCKAGKVDKGLVKEGAFQG